VFGTGQGVPVKCVYPDSSHDRRYLLVGDEARASRRTTAPSDFLVSEARPPAYVTPNAKKGANLESEYLFYSVRWGSDGGRYLAVEANNRSEQLCSPHVYVRFTCERLLPPKRKTLALVRCLRPKQRAWWTGTRRFHTMATASWQPELSCTTRVCGWTS